MNGLNWKRAVGRASIAFGVALFLCSGLVVFDRAVADGGPNRDTPTQWPVYFAPPQIEIATIAAEGDREIEVVTQDRWKLMCSSIPDGVTEDDIRAAAEEHERQLRDEFGGYIDSGARSGLNVVFSIGSGVPTAAQTALSQCEAFIETLFSDNITVTFSVTFQNLGNPNILGYTSSSWVSNLGYTTSRNGLQADMDGNDVIQSYLPAGSTVPVRFDGSSGTITNVGSVDWTKANYRAVIGNVTGTYAAITFNSQITWDYDPSNGVPGNAMSFKDVVLHEVGHGMGFVSAADNPPDLYVLDLFRFQRTAYNPSTYAEFQTTPRLVDFNVPDDDHNSDIIIAEYRMSDGDPWQASHFREQTSWIGLMDPALAPGETHHPWYYTIADLNMLDAIGWDYPPCLAPSISTQPLSQNVCALQPFSLSVVASGYEPMSYQWRKDGANISGATQSTYTVASAMPSDAGVYDCVITNDCGQATSNPATVAVLWAPSFDVQPQSQTVCAFAQVTFSVEVSGGSPYTYRWRQDGVNIPGATQPTYTIASALPSHEGDYDCVVTNSCGESISNVATLTVNLPPIINAHPQSQTVTEGDAVTFSVTVTGTEPLSYQWRKDGGVIGGATQSEYTIDPVSMGDAGQYDCVITNACGTATSNAATLTVEPGGWLLGDMDCDGDVDFDDIDPFVKALEGQAAYEATYPNCNWLNGDLDGNGQVDFDDIDLFVELLS